MVVGCSNFVGHVVPYSPPRFKADIPFRGVLHTNGIEIVFVGLV
jgi:hypothetical protein